MLQLTLIRHALTEWNSSGKFQGHSDIPLSTQGQAQARSLGKRLVKLGNVDLIYCSPLRRTVSTAQLALPGRELRLEPRLMELNFGQFEGKTMAENQQDAAWAQWMAEPFNTATPGGESYAELRRRAVAWMNELPDKGHVVAFTHSGTIQMLLSHCLGLEHPRWRKRLFLRPTSITRILVKEHEVIVERVNDTRHLPNESGDPFDD
ncbi:MAG: histidine phosphatase family protein [Truepera sp.]|nr:histidine phosphatase family protein [Truepera sp.]MBS3967571.1 histidine phosphatase family protein [Truepera sp.]